MSLKVKVPLAWFGAGALVHHAAVVCEGGRVTYAGPSAAAPRADEFLEVDGFLMPGVADRHVHIRLADPGAVLLGGVTAVRDLAWAPDEIFALANASELPTFTGPVIRAAGPMLTAPGGYPTASSWAPPGTGRELAGPEDAAAAVAELADHGRGGDQGLAELGGRPDALGCRARRDRPGGARARAPGDRPRPGARPGGARRRGRASTSSRTRRGPSGCRTSCSRRPRGRCGSSRPWTSSRSAT